MDIFKEYAKAQKTISDAEEKRDFLKAQIIEQMQKSGENKKQTQYGNFTLWASSVYEYSDSVNELVKQTKLLKIKEQEQGIAIKKETPSIRFTLPKT